MIVTVLVSCYETKWVAICHLVKFTCFRSVFLGEIDVTKCPENYIEGCKSLIHFARENYSNIPWLINTMGFTKGFGVKLICDIIKNVKPTHVIEIESKKRNLNFPMRLDPGFVHSQNFGNCATPLDYKFFIVGSGAEEKGNNSPKASYLHCLGCYICNGNTDKVPLWRLSSRGYGTPTGNQMR
ncbi:Polynucleotide 5'-hydroxyl-kinase nol9 [Homalodisca vitripennis]|nr:Polynucleotide 5'-hydroxyl-kinase nol9 [Homalodisca vitripennis]